MIYKTRKRYGGEPICADPTADPRENETALHFTAGDRRLWISSYEPTVVAGLLAHPDFQIEHLVFMKANGRECVVGVVGKLPVGALSLGRARKSDSHELVVSIRARLSGTQLVEKESKTSPTRREARQLKLKLAGKAKPRMGGQLRRARKAQAVTSKPRVQPKRRRAVQRTVRRSSRRSRVK